MKSYHPFSPLLRSDIEEDYDSRAARKTVVQQGLDAVGNLLEKAHGALHDFEVDDMLGLAMVRKCQELADSVGDLARQLESRTESERNELAQACLDAIQQDTANEVMIRDCQQGQALTVDHMKVALLGAQELLRDVESSLRSISQDDADEIADVALSLAHMFLLSLEHFLSSTSADDIVDATHGTSRDFSFSDRIEVLDDDSKSVDNPKATKQKRRRVRCLWPPLGPPVFAALQWSHEEALKQPLLAVTLGIILWPAAVVTAVIGTPVVACDGLIQYLYKTNEHTPFITTLEGVAAQALVAGKLTFLSTKLVVKQTLRVASRQVDRRGGIGAVVEEVKEMAVDRALHPVETAQQLWSGVVCTAGAVQKFVTHVQQKIAQEQEKAQAQELHI